MHRFTRSLAGVSVMVRFALSRYSNRAQPGEAHYSDERDAASIPTEGSASREGRLHGGCIGRNWLHHGYTGARQQKARPYEPG